MSATMFDAVRLARIRLTTVLPYISPAVMAMRLVKTTQVPTMAVDKHGRCYWNPSTIATWSKDQVAAVLLHEVSHLVREHHSRASALSISASEDQRQRWNMAADLEINDDIKTLPLPAGALQAKAFKLPEGQVAEWYFTHLPQDSGGSGKTSGGKGDGGDGGSCADGIPRSYELDADDAEAPGLSEIELRAVAREVAEKIQQSKMAGNMPAGWRRWAEALLAPPVVPWWRELRAAVRSAVARAAGCSDYTWMKVSRREDEASGAILPSPYRPQLSVAVVVDTSGSMEDAQGARCLSEVRGITKALGMPIDLVACDAAAVVSRRVLQPRQAKLVGGGGTSMTLGIETATRLRPRPSLIITMTDGYTDWPQKPPAIRHITMLVGKGNTPSFGKVIHVQHEG